MKYFLLFTLALCIGPASANAAEVRIPLTAAYTVPEPSELFLLERYFMVDYIVIQNEGVPDRAIFTLPDSLTGRMIDIEMSVRSVTTNPDGMVRKQLAGNYGEADCVGPWRNMACNYRFRNLNIDAAEVETLVANRFGTGNSLYETRMSVARAFERDPIGEVRTSPRR